MGVFLSSVVFAAKPDVGAVYLGNEYFTNEVCRLEVQKIEPSFFVDKITTLISVQGKAPQEITFAEYDLADGSYGNGQFEVSISGHYYRAYYSLKISDNKKMANLQMSLHSSNSFSAGTPYIRCNNLQLQ